MGDLQATIAHFKLVDSFQHKSTATAIHRYSSERTGLSVAVAQVQGPLCNAFITVRTEASDHDGCPHTLEHMVFLGSEQYPQRGYLDQLANRCLAQGTNAWTAVDHTAYTVTTAGSQGLLQVLPVYMDHVLYPTLHDAGFYTEVHHIDGDGKDAGVVYCEMDACENRGSTKTYHTLMETLYAGSSYQWNTGGRVENLRSLTADKVRKYHAHYYRAENIRLIVTGDIDPKSVLEALAPIEEKIVAKQMEAARAASVPSSIPRPFSNVQPDSIEQDLCRIVEFPSDEDDAGGALVMIGWHASCDWSHFLMRSAIDIMWLYLTESAIAPLQKVFVETQPQLCGNVYYNVTDFASVAHYIVFGNVPTVHADDIRTKFMETIGDIDRIDMSRMRNVISKKKVRHLSAFEEDPHDTFSEYLIEDFLFSENKDQLYDAMNLSTYLEELKQKDEQWWLALIRQTLLEKRHVCIVGRPSKELGQQLAQLEGDRIAQQQKELGQEKLQQLREQLHRYHEEMESYDDEDMDDQLANVPVPSVSDISFIPIVTISSADTEQQVMHRSNNKIQLWKRIVDEQKGFPCRDAISYMQVDHIHSAFYDINVYLDTANLSSRLKKCNMRTYIELYLECVFGLPMRMEDGRLLDHEQVVRMLNEETVEFSNGCGLSGGNFKCGPFAQLMFLELKVEHDKYERGVQIMHDLLMNVQFTTERLQVAASKLLNDVSRFKRRPMGMVRTALRYMNFDHHQSNHNACNVVRQSAFLANVMRRLDREPEKVIQEMEEFRRLITNDGMLRIHVIGDCMNDSVNIMSPWHRLFGRGKMAAKETCSDVSTNGVVDVPSNVLFSRQLSTGLNDCGWLLSMASTDSSYLLQSGPGIKDYADIDTRAALLVLVEYLTALEGPMWKRIRGLGLSYGYDISTSIEDGLIYFSLSQSGNLIRAYAEAKRIVEEIHNGGEERNDDESQEERHDEDVESDDDIAAAGAIDPVAFESAKSSVLFNIISDEETMHMAAELRFTHHLQGILHLVDDVSKKLLESVKRVTESDMLRVLQNHVYPLFDPRTSNICIACNPVHESEIVSGFQTMGRSLQIVDLESTIE